MTKRVAITGMGVITSLGDSPTKLHSALCQGEQASYCLENHKLDDATCTQGGSIAAFQPESYLNGKPLRPLDRTGRMVAAAAKLALENSGWTAELLAKHDVGLALGYAADLIRYREHTAILAGGADEFCFESFCGFERAGLLCKTNGHDALPVPFAAARSGFALGEAVALVMLEEWDAALARGATMLGEIRGHGSAYDSRGRREAGPETITRAMASAIDDSGMSPSEIGCISASANGSVFADRNEALAVKAFFNGRGDAIPITAIKSMVGEGLGAAGALQAVDLLETLRSSMLPGIRGLEQPDSELPELNFCWQSRNLDAACGLINSIGFDGNSCSLVIART